MRLRFVFAVFALVGLSVGEFNDDETVGMSPLSLRGSSTVPVSFEVWANPGKSALKPRQKDLIESNLFKLLGDDYDQRWMRTNRDRPGMNVSLLFLHTT